MPESSIFELSLRRLQTLGFRVLVSTGAVLVLVNLASGILTHCQCIGAFFTMGAPAVSREELSLINIII